MIDSDREEPREEGFILVTAIVLISILTILGVLSFFKTNVEIKVSQASGDSARALSVANAGLTKAFVEWGSGGTYSSEWTGIMDDIAGNASTQAIYQPTLDPDSMSDLLAHANALSPTAGSCSNGTTDVIDNFVCWADGSGSNPLVRVYELQGNAFVVVANNTWGSGQNAQAAVWATAFNASATSYPYDTPFAGGTNCPACREVTYSLGRARESRRLVREVQGSGSSTLEGVSAMTNAPTHGNFNEMCNEVDPPDATISNASTSWGSSLQNTVIDVSQAPYLRDLNNSSSSPSGVALKSNTKLGGGKKGFRDDVDSETGATFERNPMLLFSGHGSTTAANAAKAMLGEDADTNADNTAPYDNLDQLATSEAPHNLVMSPTLNTSDELEYFKDANSQLFNLDAYRWAAEQFTCQNAASDDSVNGNGRYCSKAEKLRLATGSAAPVSGRLTVAEFEYNANNATPMFGVVRVMLPTTSSGDSFNCTINGATYNSDFYEISGSVAEMTTDPAGATGEYDGTVSKVDSDGKLDGTARVLVYGTLFFDFFTDDGSGSAAGNDVFDPAAGERLLNPLEATDSYMKIEFPILVNPSMPRLGSSGSMQPFPTAAATSAPSGSANNLTVAAQVNMAGAGAVNLASPYDGTFPLSEGLIPQTGSTSYQDGLTGTMRLMSNQNPYGAYTMPAEGLVSVAEALAAAPATFPPSGASTLFSTHKTELEYYYDLMVATAGHDSFSWPIAAFPANMSGNFYIGAEDSTVGKNNGDMLHLLFPNGYMHGWKVALAALDMKADDWNNLLTDLDVNQADQNSPHKDYGDTARPKGSPFNTTADAGFAAAAALAANQSDYFKVEEDPTTGYALLTETWRDIPGEMYVGGLLDMHAHANICGVVYTPGPLEWEPGNSDYGGNDNHLAYISGAIITGYGSYVKNEKADGRYVVTYSNDAVDNINTENTIIVQRRYGWQEVK